MDRTTYPLTVDGTAWAIVAIEDEDPAVLEGRARGEHACHWADDKILDLAGGPVDCDAVRARAEQISRDVAEDVASILGGTYDAQADLDAQPATVRR